MALELRVQSGWYEPSSDIQVRPDTGQARPQGQSTSKGGVHEKPEEIGAKTPTSASSSPGKSLPNSDSGSGGSGSKDKKGTKKNSKSIGKIKYTTSINARRIFLTMDANLDAVQNVSCC